jgi:stage II sporulation protein D
LTFLPFKAFIFICVVVLNSCVLLSEKYTPDRFDPSSDHQPQSTVPSQPKKTESANPNEDPTVQSSPLKQRDSILAQPFEMPSLDMPTPQLSDSTGFELPSDFIDTPSTVVPLPYQKSIQNQALPEDLKRSLRVGLIIDASSLQIESKGYIKVIDAMSSKVLNSYPEKLTLDVINAKIRLSNNKGHKILTSDQTLIFESASAQDFLLFKNKPYRGRFKIALQNSKLVLINEVMMEDYLRGVLPHEMGTLEQWAFEALKAQAVAARTYAYKHLNSRQKFGFDVFADTRDQVYEGQKAEYALANQAIDETQGIVMAHNGTLIDAFYHSTCAGQTVSVEDAWQRPGAPWLKSVPDLDSSNLAYCSSSRMLNWSRSFSSEDLVKLAKKYLESAKPEPLLKFNQVHDIEIISRSASGRVNEVQIATDKGNFLLRADRSRWFFRDPKNPMAILPSALYRVRRENNLFVIEGGGFGHGIGLCQMGARERSRRGQSFDFILQHYYQGIHFIRYE